MKELSQLPKEAAGVMEEIAALRNAYASQYDMHAALEYPRYPDMPTPENFNAWVIAVHKVKAEAQPYLDNMKMIREREDMLRRQLHEMMTYSGAHKLLHAGLWFGVWDEDDRLFIDEAH